MERRRRQLRDEPATQAALAEWAQTEFKLNKRPGKTVMSRAPDTERVTY